MTTQMMWALDFDLIGQSLFCDGWASGSINRVCGGSQNYVFCTQLTRPSLQFCKFLSFFLLGNVASFSVGSFSLQSTQGLRVDQVGLIGGVLLILRSA